MKTFICVNFTNVLMPDIESWEYELLTIISKLPTLIFTGLNKNTGKTTAFNALNALFPDEVLGLTSIGYDGEAFDAIYNHPKPPIPVFPGQLVLTAERFLPETKTGYVLLEKWENHPQFGPWLILRITAPGNFRLAGPSTLAELRLGIANLHRHGATRIHVDGALNRLSPISLFSSRHPCPGHVRAGFDSQNPGIILSTGAALGDSLQVIVEQSLYILELFDLPTLSHVVATTNSELNVNVSFQHNAYLLQNTWSRLPAYLWCQESLIPLYPEAIYLQGAFTDAFYLALRAKKRLPQKLIVRSPAHILLSLDSWNDLKSRNITVLLLERPELALVTLCPWHPRNPIPTLQLAEALLPFTKVPLVDVQSRLVWLPTKFE
ncbi:hypothetical protein [Desulfosporosinus sp. SB140]|uniref:hypothetical protein n=1 Tax=Desulfosporosinus paludis TaxID=3115649 RepID=UPI00388EA4DC